MTHRVLPFCLGLLLLCLGGCSSQEPAGGTAKQPIEAADKEANAAAAPFPDEPAAHALYNQMIEAMRKAKSLSYVSHYETKGARGYVGDGTYRIWLKKPNYFRVEAASTKDPAYGGVLVGDGEDLWIYWPCPQGASEVRLREWYEKNHLNIYTSRPAAVAEHSISHEIANLGTEVRMTVLDPSTFHGYTDTLQPYLDGVKILPPEKVGAADCDQIEVSFMKRQRSWRLWVSKADHLPRRLKDTVRVSSGEGVINEEWSSVTLNGEMPDTLFAWKPFEGWTQLKEPAEDAGLLTPGTKAPDFELASADGKRIKLSDFRGKVVWFYFWRRG